MPPRRRSLAAALVIIAGLLATACSASSASHDAPGGQVVTAAGAENQYANVIGQIGGKYVQVTAIESNPNTDPHTFEASPGVAQAVSAAQLVVQNLLGLPDSTPNPHLWYSPATMPAVARAVARDLSAMQPAHAAYFAANLRRFDASLQPWYQAIARFKADHPGAPVAVTEPVGDYLLQAAGMRILTPFNFQADIMNGVDPSPQDVSLEDSLFSDHRVKVFVYNQQVTDSLTQSLLSLAHKEGIPVVGVYETMPTPGYDYQSWMLAGTRALQQAVTDKISTEKL